MIHVVAIITAQPGQRDTVLQAFTENMPAVHAEPGCIAYHPVIDAPGMGPIQTPLGPDSFMVLEKWESAEALMAHAAAPHMVTYAKRVKGLLTGRVIHILTDTN